MHLLPQKGVLAIIKKLLNENMNKMNDKCSNIFLIKSIDFTLF